MHTVNWEKLNIDFEKSDPKSILRWGVETFGEKLVIVTSFQPTGIATLHMLMELGAKVPIVTLDTGILFPETYDLINKAESFFGLPITRIRPELTLQEQATAYGEALWERDSDKCCHIRKVVPLDKVLKGQYSAWVTGLRRDQTGREKTPVIKWDEKYNMVKLSPFATWTSEMLWIYIHAHELPYNELHEKGYPSIGCNTSVCTRPVAEDESDRAGRWINSDKVECGIHITTKEG